MHLHRKFKFPKMHEDGPKWLALLQLGGPKRPKRPT